MFLWRPFTSLAPVVALQWRGQGRSPSRRMLANGDAEGERSVQATQAMAEAIAVGSPRAAPAHCSCIAALDIACLDDAAPPVIAAQITHTSVASVAAFARSLALAPRALPCHQAVHSKHIASICKPVHVILRQL